MHPSPVVPFVSKAPTFTRPPRQLSSLPWKSVDQKGFDRAPWILITVITPPRPHQKGGRIRPGLLLATLICMISTGFDELVLPMCVLRGVGHNGQAGTAGPVSILPRSCPWDASQARAARCSHSFPTELSSELTSLFLFHPPPGLPLLTL
jgi:hypothetical protein